MKKIRLQTKYSKILFSCLPFFFLVLSCAGTEKVYTENVYTEDAYIEDVYNVIPDGVDISGSDISAASMPEPEAVAMLPYEGPILNIFFHALVARPEIAFRGSMKKHFTEWYVTADEYRKILHELYMNNYVLVDIKEIYEVIERDGSIRVIYRPPLVPEGKKPMILSVDDLSYYEYVKANGSVHKLVIDEKGGIAAWTDNGKGGELSYDLDAVTYLEEFIKRHPDFSIRGAKGILALTGFEGILGYHTHKLNAPEYREETEKAIAVVNRLKELNWRFASHSWRHINIQEKPLSSLTHDQRLWDEQVKHILGDTDLFMYPYGAGVERQADKHKFLRDQGFRVFFGVGRGFGHNEFKEYLYFERRNIDGVYFRYYKDRRDRLFDIDKVMDTEMRMTE